MTDSMYRELTPDEMKQAMGQKDKRSQSERIAYRLLPWSMRQRVEQNPAIAFKDCNVVFFPDLLFRNERICIEIDGGYHFKRQRQDEYRDIMFKSHGFIVIRIKNLDTRVDVAFWQRLLEVLEKDGGDRSDIRPFVSELRQMIDNEMSSWTKME